MVQVEVRGVGSAAGIVPPREALAGPRVEKGDAPHLAETEDGGPKAMPHDPAFARQMEAAEAIMRGDRDARWASA